MVANGAPPVLSIDSDEVLRFSNLEPVGNVSANAYDSDGIDISDDISVSILQNSIA